MQLGIIFLHINNFIDNRPIYLPTGSPHCRSCMALQRYHWRGLPAQLVTLFLSVTLSRMSAFFSRKTNMRRRSFGLCHSPTLQSTTRGLTSELYTLYNVLCHVRNGLFVSIGWAVFNYILTGSAHVEKDLKAFNTERGTTGLCSHVSSHGEKVSYVIPVRVPQRVKR